MAATEALTLLANQVRQAATWNTGAREAYLNQVADRLEEVRDGGPLDWVPEDKKAAEDLAAAEAVHQRELEAAAAQEAAKAQKSAQEAAQRQQTAP